MRALPIALAVALLAGAASAAPAAAAPTPGASYSGGLVPKTYAGKFEDYAIATAEVRPDGRSVGLVVNATFACGRRTAANQQVLARGDLGPDGRLRITRRSRNYLYVVAGIRPRGRATIDLTFDGPSATGSVRFVTRVRKRRCAATLPLQLRVTGPDTSAPAPATPDLYLYGSSDALYHGLRSPLALHVRPDGKKIDLTLLGVPLRCGSPGGSPPFTDYLPNYTPPATIAPDGSFSKVERFPVRTRDGVTRTVVRLKGQFTAQGVIGTYSATARGPRKRCSTGRVAWSAVR